VISTLDVTPKQIRLLYDGTPIDMKKRSSIVVDRVAPGDYAISLLNLRVSDSGRYDYEIEGVPTPKHLVTLYVEPHQPNERFVQLPQTTFTVGQTILLSIDLDVDEPMDDTPSWYRNEMLIPLDRTQRHRQTIDPVHRTYTFEIQDSQLDDSGIYEMRTNDLIVKTPEIKIMPNLVTSPLEQEEVLPPVKRVSSVTIDMNKNREQTPM
jgi:hypothetical protein